MACNCIYATINPAINRTERYLRQSHYRGTAEFWQPIWEQSQQESRKERTHKMTDVNSTISTHGDDYGEERAVCAQIKLLSSVDFEYLTQTNHEEWQAAIQDTWIIYDADWIVQGIEQETVLDERQCTNMVAAVRAQIRNPIPEIIWVELPVWCLSQQPLAIIQYIAAMYLKNSETVHRRLEVE